MKYVPVSSMGDMARQFEKMFSFDIWPYTTLCKFKAGEYLCRQGQAENKLYYVIKGRCKILINQPNGKTSLVSYVQAPAFVGELEMLQSQKESHDVAATSSVTAFVIDVSGCRKRLLQDVTFLQTLCIFLSQKTLQTSLAHSKNDSFRLEIRLADFILKNASHGIYSEPHTETCQFFGVSYRHLLYVIADFVDKGYLQKQGRKYIISDKEGLLALAGEMD